MKIVSPDGLANMLVSEPCFKHSSTGKESGRIIVLSREQFLASKESDSDCTTSYQDGESKAGDRIASGSGCSLDFRDRHRPRAEAITLRAMKQFAKTYPDSYIGECLLTAIGLEGQQGFIDTLHYFGVIDEWQG